MKSLRQFEIVIEIARQGSISKAAETLGISQSTLSKLLQKLENELQVVLFDRSVLPLKLTPAGKLYSEAGQSILNIQRQLNKDLDRIKDHSANHICIGISPSRAPYIMPDILLRYRERHPDGSVHITEGNTAQLNTALLRGEADIIISLLNDSTKAFRCVPLLKETTLLAVPEKMAVLSADEILHTQPFISIGSGLRMWESTKLIMESINRPLPEIECTSIESALSLVRKGFGAMFAPSYLAAGCRGRGDVRFIPLPEEYYRKFPNELERSVCLFYKSDAFLSKTEESFISVCREYAASVI